MHMLRHYFISDNLDDLETFEEQLEAAGVSTPHIHVLSMHDEDVAHHDHLNYVQSFMKKDILHSTELGALIGLCATGLLLAVAHYAGWTESAAGWMPFIFLSVILLGFCTWEGGLLGIQTPNYHFAKFSEALKEGKHIFFVDTEPYNEKVLEEVFQKHPQVEMGGTGSATPKWIIELQDRVPRFFRTTFP